jgi:hypothetical protein
MSGSDKVAAAAVIVSFVERVCRLQIVFRLEPRFS